MLCNHFIACLVNLTGITVHYHAEYQVVPLQPIPPCISLITDKIKFYVIKMFPS